METWVGLLRGINVGSGRAVPMADLRTLAERLGWDEVRTYIQSGNLVFKADGNPESLARHLGSALAEVYPFPIPILVRSAACWASLASDTPFGGWSDPKQLSATLLGGVPGPSAWAALEPWKDGNDEIELSGDRVWVKTPGGYGNTKFTNAFLEKKLGLAATTRNRATVDAILGML